MSDLFWSEPEPTTPVAAFKEALVRRSMTEREKLITVALDRCSMGLARSMTRFAQDMARLVRSTMDPQITEAQARYLTILAWRFRRQMPVLLAYPLTDEELARYRIDLVGK